MKFFSKIVYFAKTQKNTAHNDGCTVKIIKYNSLNLYNRQEAVNCN